MTRTIYSVSPDADRELGRRVRALNSPEAHPLIAPSGLPSPYEYCGDTCPQCGRGPELPCTGHVPRRRDRDHVRLAYACFDCDAQWTVDFTRAEAEAHAIATFEAILDAGVRALRAVPTPRPRHPGGVVPDGERP
jgi:hypothetical protein